MNRCRVMDLCNDPQQQRAGQCLRVQEAAARLQATIILFGSRAREGKLVYGSV
jgi:hypothetical protein